ncbi:MAG: hypothetical protein A2091_06035 [Desulfuromonadales bacterium GWD2_61_12]|nr:MAG: hypothetical protein A2091_06035 [Desulfuromonadales bacterium GWD2_61_12]
MGSLVIVVMQVCIQILLHLVDGLIPNLPPLDTEVLVQQGSVQALDKTVALWSADLGGAMLDPFELQEELVGMLVGASTKLATVVRQNRCNAGPMLVKEGEHVFVQHMHGGQW